MKLCLSRRFQYTIGSKLLLSSVLILFLAVGLSDAFLSSCNPRSRFPSQQQQQRFVETKITASSTHSSTKCWAKKPKKKAPKKGSSSVAGGFGRTTASGSAATSTSNDTSSSKGGSPPSWAETFSFAGSIQPGYIAPQKTIPKSVVDSKKETLILPDYAVTSRPKSTRPMLPWVIEVKNEEQIQKMRASGALARKVLDAAGRAARPGTTTHEIDELVHALTLENGAYPSPLNYHGFPKSCCTSVNEVICHGIPDDRPLQKGDIINIDITVYLNGYHGDCSEMFVVGYPPVQNYAEYGEKGMEQPDGKTKSLLQATYDCWIKSMNIVKPGNFYKDIGGIIEDHITPLGFSTVRNFCGHGVGSVFHTNPSILHYKNNEPNGQMDVGHTFTIEPMICEGSSKALIWPDNWTATTIDGKRTAQFEHTLLVTEDGVEALTGKTSDSPIQFWEIESKYSNGGFWLGTSKNAIEKSEQIMNEKKKKQEQNADEVSS